jgi:hypothetical protein
MAAVVRSSLKANCHFQRRDGFPLLTIHPVRPATGLVCSDHLVRTKDMAESVRLTDGALIGAWRRGLTVAIRPTTNRYESPSGKTVPEVEEMKG